MMRIAICEDQLAARDEIKRRLQASQQAEQFSVVLEFESAEELLEDYSRGVRFDAVFLDVEMGDLDGINAGKAIKNIDPRTIIVFVSSYPQYAVFSYDCDALYYITKPIDSQRFERVLHKVVEKYKLLHKTYILKNRGDVKSLRVGQILYIEIYRKHLIFHTKDGQYETIGRISEALEELKIYGFCQVHQGYLVNMSHIVGFDQYDVIMSNGEKVMMSVRKKADVLREYTNFLERV